MNIAERQVEFPIDKNQDTLRKSLDRLELKYEKALQEWQQTSKLCVEKDGLQVFGSSNNHLPKRLPNLITVSDIIGSVPLEEGMKKKLVQVVSEGRMQEIQMKALEHTLQKHTIKLQYERNQQLYLQHQLHTVLHKKEEVKKLMQRIKADILRETTLAGNAERILVENVERLAKLDEEVVKIRRDATELLQVYWVRNNVLGQVEAFNSKLTALEEKKTKAMERISCLQGEEATLALNMNAVVTKVCAEQGENAVQLDGNYHILWSNVDMLLEYCNKLLQMTRPEVEALKFDAVQTVRSNGVLPLVAHSQVEISDNHLKVTPTDAESDVLVSQILPFGQDINITQLQESSKMVELFTRSHIENIHDEHPVLSMDIGDEFGVDNTEVDCQDIIDEDPNDGDTVACQQALQSVEVQFVAKATQRQFKHPLPNQTRYDSNLHPIEELTVESISAVLTQNKRTNEITDTSASPVFHGDDGPILVEIQPEYETSLADTSVDFAEAHFPILNGTEKCSTLSNHSDLHEPVVILSVPNRVVQGTICSPIVYHNDHTIVSEGSLPQVCNTLNTAPSTSNFVQPCGSDVSTPLTFHTICAGYQIKSRTTNEKTLPSNREETQGDKNGVLVVKIIDEKEIDTSGNQAKSPLALEQNKSDSTTFDEEHMPSSTIIILTEKHSSQVSSLHPYISDHLASTSYTSIAAEKLTSDCNSSTHQLNTTSVPLSVDNVDERNKSIHSIENQHQKTIQESDIMYEQTSFGVSSDIQCTKQATPMREHNAFLSYPPQQNES